MQTSSAIAPSSERSRQARRPLSLLTFAGLVLAMLGGVFVLVAFFVAKGSYGSDWLTFYQAGERWRHGQRVYTVAYGYFNPPPFLLLMRVATLFGYERSRVLWGAASTAMLLLSAELSAKACGIEPSRRQRLIGALWVMFSAPVVLLVPVTGNLTALVLIALALSLPAFARGQDGRAGALLACTLVKPQLAFLVPLLLLYKRRWRALAGYCGAVVAAVLVTLPFTGPRIFGDYVQVQRSVSGWTSNNGPLQLDVPGIHGMLLQRWPQAQAAEVAAFLGSLVLVAALAWYWRGPWRPTSPSFAAGWAQLSLVTLLVTSFAHSYDLVLLILPAVALAATRVPESMAQPSVRRFLLPALAGLYLAPYLVLLFRQHFMVPAMLAAAAVLWQAWPSASAPDVAKSQRPGIL